MNRKANGEQKKISEKKGKEKKKMGDMRGPDDGVSEMER